MEKIKLNNQIVSMRKFVKQAKVHVINKLVKEIKLLQNRKGDEIKVQKAKRKAERFLEAVALLKKIKPDEVSKLVLLKAKDWTNVLQQKNATLHDRCIAMLANYGAVQKEVEAFYSVNKELVLKIPEYIALWEEKEKNKSPKDSPKTSKMLSERKLKFKNERLSASKKNKHGTVDRTKSEFDTGLKVSHEEGARNSDSDDDEDDDQMVKIQQTNNCSNPIKNVMEAKSLYKSDNSIETKESDRCDEEMTDISFKNNNKSEDAENSSNEESDNSDEDNEEMTDISFKNNNSKDAEDSSNEESDDNDEDSEEMTETSLKCTNKEDTKDSKNEENNTDIAQESASKLDFPFKKDNNAKNKLKAIALLNLNELEGLDEIPVANSFENEKSDEDESSEDEANETSEDRSTDPFFLGHNKEDSLQNKNTDPFFLGNDSEDTYVKKDFSKKSDVSRDSVKSFKDRTENAKSFSHKRKDGFSPVKGFQKSSYNQRNGPREFQNSKSFSHNRKDGFSRDKGFQKSSYNQRNGPREFQNSKSFSHGRKDGLSPDKGFKKSSYNQRNGPKKFQNERMSDKSFKKGEKFTPANYNNKFQERNRNDFKLKSSPTKNTYDKKQFKNDSRSYGNKDDNMQFKNKEPFKKSNASSESLHPSWEAKRKQKELLSTSFQGKRMVFDD